MRTTFRATDGRWQLDVDINSIDVTTVSDRIDHTVPGRPRFDLRLASFADVVAAIRGVDPAISEAEIRAIKAALS